MYSVLCSDINTENTLESLIALSFPSKSISNFSVRRKPEESVNTEIYFQGILLEKFDENRGESVKSETSTKNQKSISPKNDLKINGNVIQIGLNDTNLRTYDINLNANGRKLGLNKSNPEYTLDINSDQINGFNINFSQALRLME